MRIDFKTFLPELGACGERGTTGSPGRAPGAARCEMTSGPQEIGPAAARLKEIEFAVVLSRFIESIEHDPAQLRSAVYELARIKLREEVCRGHPPINSPEVGRLTLALESAIEGVETIHSKHDELRALRFLHRLIESSEIGRSEAMIKPREPLLIIEQPAAQTADANHRAKRASLNLEGLLRWPGGAPLLRGALIVIFGVALCAVLSQFGQIRRLAALSPHTPPQHASVLRAKAALASPSQPKSAPTAPPASAHQDAQIQDRPANLVHRHLVDAAAPAVVSSDAPSYSGHHDPRTAAQTEPAKPSAPGCRRSYEVQSETGGKVSIDIVRC